MFRETIKLVVAAILLALSTIPMAHAEGWDKFRAGPLRVVTQNLYVGGDILLPLSVPPEQFPAAAAEVVGQILATNYPERG